MKKLLVIILILTMLVTCFCACGKEKGMEEPKRPDIEINDVSNSVVIYILTDMEYAPQENEVIEWEDYIRDKYAISINVAYVISDDNSFESTANRISLDDFGNLNDKNGLVLAEHSDFDELIDMGLVKPINDLIQEIKLMGSMNPAVLGSFTDNQGNLWACPFTDSFTSRTRVYSEEWLKKAGVGVPYSIEDFREYAEFVISGDPDGNNEADTYIQEYHDYSIFSDFMDIFHAFGCYPDYYGPFGYNPKTNRIENVVLNENFPEAMKFILRLKADELIVEGNFFGYDTRSGEQPKYKVASCVISGYYPDYWEGLVESYGIRELNETQLSMVEWGDAGYMILSDTEDPAGMLDALYYISGQELGFLDLAFGRQGYNYEVKDDYYNLIYEDEDGNARNQIKIYFLSDETAKGIYTAKSFIYNSDTSSLIFKDRRMDAAYWEDDTAAGHLLDGLAYILPFEADVRAIRELDTLMNEDTYKTIRDIMRNTVSIESAVRMYSDKLEEKGIPEKIDELNSKLGD